MRLACLAIAALLIFAGGAAAQAPDRVGPPPKQPSAEAAPAPRPQPPPPPRPAQSFASGGITGGLTGFQPLRAFPAFVGLSPAGDAAPLCRAACAKVHNQCSGQGEDSCDANWTQCVTGCRTAR